MSSWISSPRPPHCWLVFRLYSSHDAGLRRARFVSTSMNFQVILLSLKSVCLKNERKAEIANLDSLLQTVDMEALVAVAPRIFGAKIFK